jgi:diguanylate cyclase (GGDEF)-like protein/PAS domain S-box-containing protein
MNSNFEEQANSLLMAYLSSLVTPLISQDYLNIKELLDDWMSVRIVQAITLSDLRDNVIAHKEQGEFEKHDSKRYYAITGKIEFDGETYGSLKVVFDRGSIDAAKTEADAENFAVAILAIILSIGAASFLIYYYTGGIQDLISASNKVAQGDLSVRVSPKGNDEISSLMANFNVMLNNIQGGIMALRRREMEFRAIADYTYAWENWFDKDGKIKWVNPAVEKITGYSPEECLNMADFPLPIVHPGDIKIFNRHRRLAENQKSGQDLEFRVRNKAGRDIWVVISWQPIYNKDGDNLGYRSSIRDISVQHDAAEELSYQAEHDSLTGLNNRRTFESQLKLTLDWAQQDKRSVCVFYIDLDQFKVVNDVSGHIAGDQLLIAIAKLLMQHTAYGFLARMGGDEFAILYRDVDYEEAKRRADLIIQDIRNYSFTFAGRVFKIGASIGVVFAQGAINSLTKILIAADTACYAAKERGRGMVVFYDENDEYFRMRNEEFSSVAHINTALSQGRFMLYFQREQPTKEGDRQHAEILIRMRDLSGNIHPPSRFITAAERFNLMPYIDRWVIDSVCRQLHEWDNNNIEHDVYRFAINISGASLSDREFPTFVAERIAKYNIDPDRLIFEITESCMISQLNLAIAFVEKMHSLNASLALDDFGSGLSSFAYLKQFKVDYLKIDGQFVKNLDNDRSDQAVVESMIQLANAYGLKTVAEYVCNDEIYEIVKKLGVNYVQGYACHTPEPLANLPQIGQKAVQNDI